MGNVRGSFPAVYKSDVNQKFRVLHVPNLSVINFRFCPFMYPEVCVYRRPLSAVWRRLVGPRVSVARPSRRPGAAGAARTPTGPLRTPR